MERNAIRLEKLYLSVLGDLHLGQGTTHSSGSSGGFSGGRRAISRPLSASEALTLTFTPPIAVAQSGSMETVSASSMKASIPSAASRDARREAIVGLVNVPTVTGDSPSGWDGASGARASTSAMWQSSHQSNPGRYSERHVGQKGIY